MLIKPMNIAIIIPTYNEKENIINLVKDISARVKESEILIIDDSKTDHISDKIKNFNNVKLIFRGEKLGRGSAILEGFKYFINNSKAEIYVEMDADYSHDPSELKDNLFLHDKNNYDLLISSRYLKDSKIINWPLPRRIFSFLANKLARFMLGVPISDYTNGYRIYSKEAVKHISKNCGKIGDGFIILSEILVELYYNNFRVAETKSNFVNRVRGESSVNLKEIINSFFGLIKIFKLKNKIKLKSL